MTKVIVFHYTKSIRDEIVNALRNAGCVTYSANEPWQAWQAIQLYRPDAVVTDFPAVIEHAPAKRQTLTEAIRATPDLAHIKIISVSQQSDRKRSEYAAKAGVSLSLPASRGAIIEAICGTATELRGGARPG